jgi:hypothetical protein
MNKMPPVSQQILENFLTFLQDPKNNTEAYSNLPSLESKLENTEDKPIELATTIRDWGKEFGIDFSRELRVGMYDDEESESPPRPKGDLPRPTINKFLILDNIKKEKEKKPNE